MSAPMLVAITESMQALHHTRPISMLRGANTMHIQRSARDFDGSSNIRHLQVTRRALTAKSGCNCCECNADTLDRLVGHARAQAITGKSDCAEPVRLSGRRMPGGLGRLGRRRWRRSSGADLTPHTIARDNESKRTSRVKDLNIDL